MNDRRGLESVIRTFRHVRELSEYLYGIKTRLDCAVVSKSVIRTFKTRSGIFLEKKQRITHRYRMMYHFDAAITGPANNQGNERRGNNSKGEGTKERVLSCFLTIKPKTTSKNDVIFL